MDRYDEDSKVGSEIREKFPYRMKKQQNWW